MALGLSQEPTMQALVFNILFNFSDKLSLNSQIGVNANKEDRTLAVRNYFWSWAARRLLYKDWFFAELSPILGWARENEWDPKWSFFFRLGGFLVMNVKKSINFVFINTELSKV